MRKKLAFLSLAIAFGCTGLKAQQVDPTLMRKLPAGAKVHVLTEDEFQKLVAKSPTVPPQGTEGPVVKNPNASALETAALAELAKQKQVADSDLSQIRAAHPMGNLPAVHSQAIRGGVSRPNIGPERTQGEPTSASRYGRLSMSGNQVNGCYATSNGQVTIGKVTGQSYHLVFTPISQFNLYTIHGCNFGDSKPGNKAWIYGPGFHADFQIEDWTDSSIALKLGENISGVSDQDNLHLVVHRADGKEAQAEGFRFYAVRERVLLKYVPPAWRKLDTNVTGRSHWDWRASLQDNSPVSGPNVPAQAAGTSTIYVGRRLGDKFAPASDTFDFSQLPKGWVVDSVAWVSFPANCPNIVTYRENFGQWNAQWSASKIQFSWGDTSCSGFWPNPILGIPTNVYQNHTESNYALRVWVKGPRGMESMLPHM